jgi:hypothetical protein
LPGSQAAVGVASARKEKSTNPSWGRRDVIIDCFSGLFAQFEPDGMSGFSLPDGGTIDGDTVWGHIFNLQADHVATA